LVHLRGFSHVLAVYSRFHPHFPHMWAALPLGHVCCHSAESPHLHFNDTELPVIKRNCRTQDCS